MDTNLTHGADSQYAPTPSSLHEAAVVSRRRTLGELLGTGSVALHDRTFRSYRSARDQDWRAWCAAGNRPPDISGAPDQIYRGNGWTSWGDFFGTSNPHPARVAWKTVREAMPIVRALGIRSRAEVLEAKRSGKLPRGIQLTIERRPDRTNWETVLGTD